jgi:hypothetical protein
VGSIKRLTIIGALVVVYLAVTLIIAMPALYFFSQKFGAGLYRSTQMVIGYFGESKLTLGIGCDQFGERCIPSFNYEGAFNDYDDDRFDRSLGQLMVAHPDVSTVCFNSPGGLNQVAAHISKTIKGKGLDTCVADTLIKNSATFSASPRFTSSCQSACVFVLLAGKKRISIGDRFIIGFHSTVAGVETSNDNDRDGVKSLVNNLTDKPSYMSKSSAEAVVEYYRDSISISDGEFNAILSETSRTPATRMYYPPLKSLYMLNVFNDRH